MNDKRDMAPMVWGYIKSRETARRMAAYAGEVTGMHPHFAHDSAARASDMDLETTKAYAGPNHLSAGIQHGMFSPVAESYIRQIVDVTECKTGSWSNPLEPTKPPAETYLNSNRQSGHPEIQYSEEDIKHIEKWGESTLFH
jgi:alcohol oxidase